MVAQTDVSTEMYPDNDAINETKVEVTPKTSTPKPKKIPAPKAKKQIKVKDKASNIDSNDNVVVAEKIIDQDNEAADAIKKNNESIVGEKLNQEKIQPKSQIDKSTHRRKNQNRRIKTQQEKIEEQSNPVTRLAGHQKTIRVPLTYTSDIIHHYLQLNQSTMLSAYERLAALLRMVSRDKPLSEHVSQWISKNAEICSVQLKELQEQRQSLEENLEDVELPEIIIPDSYKTVFEASHPIVHKMITLARAVDIELSACENLYHSGQLDDYEYTRLKEQATSIIRGSVDRIYKATKPGVRNGGRFSPKELAQWIREGNKLMFVDIPMQFQHITEDVETKSEST